MKIATNDQLGDLFTKGLDKVSFENLRKMLMGWWSHSALLRGSIAGIYKPAHISLKTFSQACSVKRPSQSIPWSLNLRNAPEGRTPLSTPTFFSVNSYFLVDNHTSLQQTSGGINPWPYISLTSSDTEWRGHTLLHPTSVYPRHSFIFSSEQAPEDYSSIDLCRILLASSRRS